MTAERQSLPERLSLFQEQAEALIWPGRLSNYNRWQRAGLRALQIAYAVVRDLGSGQLSLRAMGLVYYTVIAMVPLLALTFSVLKGLGVHNTLEPTLLSVLEPFLGEYANDITVNVVSFVENIRVDVLSFVSLGVLLYTVLNMMKKMEGAFNYIWNVSRSRSLSNRISEYLFAIIGSPLLILISVGIASYVNTNFFVRYLDTLAFGAIILQFIGFVTPLLFMSLAFAFAYRFIPNTRVQFSSAFIGGIVTTFAWKGLGWVFSNFIAVSSANAVIYATFFALILLMLMLYLGWLVLLIGSSVAFYHQYPSRTRTGRKPLRLSMEAREEAVLTIAALIVQRYQRQEKPWSLDRLLDHTHVNSQVVEEALQTLQEIGFIYATADDPRRYLPAAAVNDSGVLALRRRIRRHSHDRLNEHSPCDEQQAVRALLERCNRVLEDQLDDVRFSQLTDPDKMKPDDSKKKDDAS